jgi:hypothetical protein
MLSFRRLAVTASVAAALAVPAAAQARPDVAPVSTPAIDKVSPEVVEADNGFEWGDAAIGGGAALLLTVLVGGAAAAIRPRYSAAIR